MTAHTLIEKLVRFEGEELLDVIDEIERIARASGYTINVIDPQFNTGSIDNDFSRLNIRTDKDSVITSFRIG
jgi:hypothetical protein